MDQYRFLLVSRASAEADKIVSEVHRNKLYKVKQVESAREALVEMYQDKPHALILNINAFTMDRISLITDLRDLGFAAPVIIFASKIQKEVFEPIRRLPHSVIIEKPYESKDVWGICEKFVQGRRVYQRIHRRFYVNQEVALRRMTNGEFMAGRAYNMSVGGTYMELGYGRLSAGEIVKLSVPLDRMGKTYNVDAEVVWASGRVAWNGSSSAGLRFVRASDVYRNLLNRL
jgi:CheY-like chemotaxis protein